MNIDTIISIAMTALAAIEYDYYHHEEIGEVYGPAKFFGALNPEGAHRVRGFAQKIIFDRMEAAGMPLCGWNNFDSFVEWLELGLSVEEAWILRDVGYRSGECQMVLEERANRGPIKRAVWHEPDDTKPAVNGGWDGWWEFIH